MKISLSDKAVHLARQRGGVMALDYIPPIG